MTGAAYEKSRRLLGTPSTSTKSETPAPKPAGSMKVTELEPPLTKTGRIAVGCGSPVSHE